MCGFVCLVKRECNDNKFISEDLLNHRGPDFTNEVNFKSVSIRHWRLSIVDLSENSNQPIVNEDYIFAYNGEIYNYQDVSKKYFNKIFKSDTNLFFQLLISGQIQKIRNCSGFFSYLLLNKSKMIISGGRDILGKKPLYYFIDADYAIFASEESAIVKLLNSSLKINKKSLISYLYFKSIFFGNTIFSDIKELPPGSSFIFNIKKWSFEKDYDWQNYYSLPLKERINAEFLDNPYLQNYKFTKENLINTLSDSIQSRFKCDVPLQLALSSGIDSTLIANLIAKNINLKNNFIRALTVGFDHEFDESKNSIDLSSQLNLKHKVLKFQNENFLELLKLAIKYQSSMLEHPHSLSYFVLCREARKKGKVLITGEGADELFFGYGHYENKFCNSFAFRPFLDTKKYFHKSKTNFEIYFKDEFSFRNEALKSKYRSRDLEFKTHLLGLLKRNDRMSMSNSVEIRAPFLDLQLINLVLNDRDPNLHGFYQKKYFEKYLSKNINFYKKPSRKIGFHVPFDAWYLTNQNNKVLRNIIDTGIETLYEICDLEIINKNLIEPRFAWILVNVGLFVEEFKCKI